ELSDNPVAGGMTTDVQCIVVAGVAVSSREELLTRRRDEPEAPVRIIAAALNHDLDAARVVVGGKRSVGGGQQVIQPSANEVSRLAVGDEVILRRIRRGRGCW